MAFYNEEFGGEKGLKSNISVLRILDLFTSKFLIVEGHEDWAKWGLLDRIYEIALNVLFEFLNEFAHRF